MTIYNLKPRHRTYDRKSYKLAEHFLQDHPDLNNQAKTHYLAVAIQTAVEEWIDFEESLHKQGVR